MSLLIQLCGFPLLGILTITSIGLSVFAWFLAFRVRNQHLLAAYLPLTALPILPVLFVLLTGNVSSIALQVNADADIAIDSGLAFQMNLIPLFVGLLFATPAAAITVTGRWILVWRESGVELFPKSDEPESQVIDPADYDAKEAEDYLEQLIRPR